MNVLECMNAWRVSRIKLTQWEKAAFMCTSGIQKALGEKRAAEARGSQQSAAGENAVVEGKAVPATRVRAFSSALTSRQQLELAKLEAEQRRALMNEVAIVYSDLSRYNFISQKSAQSVSTVKEEAGEKRISDGPQTRPFPFNDNEAMAKWMDKWRLTRIKLTQSEKGAFIAIAADMAAAEKAVEVKRRVLLLQAIGRGVLCRRLLQGIVQDLRAGPRRPRTLREILREHHRCHRVSMEEASRRTLTAHRALVRRRVLTANAEMQRLHASLAKPSQSVVGKSLNVMRPAPAFELSARRLGPLVSSSPETTIHGRLAVEDSRAMQSRVPFFGQRPASADCF